MEKYAHFLHEYRVNRVIVSDFVYYVLINDLYSAILVADAEELRDIRYFVEYLVNELERGIYGSKEKVDMYCVEGYEQKIRCLGGV